MTVLVTRRKIGSLGLRRLRDLAPHPAIEPVHDRGGRAGQQVEALEDRPRVREGGGVGRGGAGGDDVERVADDVREQERVHAGRRGGARELASLEQGAVLPHRVQLVDVGARGQQQAGHRLLVRERDRGHRRRGQGRAATRDQDQEQVVRAGRLRHRADLTGRPLSARVGYRVAGLHEADAAGGGPVAVLHHDQPVRDCVAERSLGRGGHRPRGLARAHHEHAAGRGETHVGEGAADQRSDVGGREPGVEDRAGRLAEGQRASFCSRRPASISMSSVLGKQKRILVRPSSPWA